MEASELIAFSSMLIALLALGATFWQAYLSREHNKLSVTPNLVVHRNTVDENCKFILENNGLGPAIIKEFKLVVLGKELPGFNESTYDEALRILGLDVTHTFFFPSELEHVSPMKQIELFDLRTKDEENLEVEITNIAKNLKFKIIYTSIYRDKDYEYLGNS